MNSLLRKLFIVGFLTFVTLPWNHAFAAPESVVGPSIQTLINRVIDGATALPTVPTTDNVQAVKEVKLCVSIFGKKICFPGLDKIAINIFKAYIERMVDSTVDWINNGFDGNPAYVSNPEQYFSDIADGVIVEFIEGSDLNFLCSPFKAQVQIALQKSYSQSSSFQCRLTSVVDNIENFYGDFSQGGWEAWFTMTQDNANNPYGSYLEAKIELDSRLAAAIGLKEQQLSWGKGFLSMEKCDARTVSASESKSGKEECVDTSGNPVPKRIVTPGTAIEGQLQNVLGTGVRQLELADEFDELVGALLGQLLQKTVFSSNGLFDSKHKTYGGEREASATTEEPESTPQCSAPLPLPSGTAPNMRSAVNQIAAEYPELLKASAYNFDFLDKVVERLHSEDPNWGYNGKRGDTNNLSQDAIAYMSDSSNPRSVHIIDIIAGHGGPNPAPGWIDVTADTYNCGTVGVYVYPRPNNSAPAPDPSSQI